jgi:hypothetical protein
MGSPMRASSLRAGGLPVALIFTGANCGSCTALYPHLSRWQATLANNLRIALVISGDPEAARPVCEEHGPTGTWRVRRVRWLA